MSEFDTLIINGKEVKEVKDAELNAICEFGERTNLYNLELELVDGSPDDLKLKEIFANRNKYNISINIELKEKI